MKADWPGLEGRVESSNVGGGDGVEDTGQEIVSF